MKIEKEFCQLSKVEQFRVSGIKGMPDNTQYRVESKPCRIFRLRNDNWAQVATLKLDLEKLLVEHLENVRPGCTKEDDPVIVGDPAPDYPDFRDLVSDKDYKKYFEGKTYSYRDLLDFAAYAVTHWPASHK